MNIEKLITDYKASEAYQRFYDDTLTEAKTAEESIRRELRVYKVCCWQEKQQKLKICGLQISIQNESDPDALRRLMKKLEKAKVVYAHIQKKKERRERKMKMLSHISELMTQFDDIIDGMKRRREEQDTEDDENSCYDM